MTRHSYIGLELLRRRCCWPEVALGEASQPADSGGIVISSKAVWGPRPSCGLKGRWPRAETEAS